MVSFTIDVLLIGIATVILIGLIKTPIKILLAKRGYSDSSKAKYLFKAITTIISFIFCFGTACAYFKFYLNVDPFVDLKVLAYTLGVLGASQTIYQIYETYGRDGLLVLIKNTIQNRKLTDLASLNIDTEMLTKQINSAIQEGFENAPDVSEIVKQLLEQKFNKIDTPKT